jgi:hypothetical protein
MSQPYDPTARPRPPEPASYETQRETEAALAARMELGPEYSEHIAAGLAERVEQLAAYRTAELRQQSQRQTFEEKLEKDAQSQRFVLGIISLGAGIPITAISATNVEPGLLGVAVAWAGIVGVNVANALASRRRRP